MKEERIMKNYSSLKTTMAEKELVISNEKGK